MSGPGPAHEQPAQHRIAAFGDSQLRVVPPGLVPPGTEPEIGPPAPAAHHFIEILSDMTYLSYRLWHAAVLFPLIFGCSHAAANRPGNGLASSGMRRDESERQQSTFIRLYHSQLIGPASSMRDIVRDSARWSKAWAQVQRGNLTVEPLPAVDFSRDMVLIAALGSVGSGGYDVAVDSVAATRSEYLIFVRTTDPGNCPVTGLLTRPVDMVRVTRTGLPVRFIEQAVVSRC